MSVINTIQLKRGNKAILTAKLIGAAKPLQGEPVYELDTNKIKIGDGVHNYADLPYLTGESSSSQLIFKNKYEFPSVGELDKLYIASDEKNIYMWTGNKYSILSVDNREIDGGSADTTF